MSLRHRASLANLAPLVRRSCLFRRSYAMLVNIQVLGIGVADASPSVVLNVDNKRYLFNCGEGTQRLCNEYKVMGTASLFTTQGFIRPACQSWSYIKRYPSIYRFGLRNLIRYFLLELRGSTLADCLVQSWPWLMRVRLRSMFTDQQIFFSFFMRLGYLCIDAQWTWMYVVKWGLMCHTDCFKL